MKYVATFYTHVAAMMTHRAMQKAGVPARLAPVPRMLSSSCGTCVLYEAEHPCEALLDTDVEQVARCDGETYTILKRND